MPQLAIIESQHALKVINCWTGLETQVFGGGGGYLWLNPDGGAVVVGVTNVEKDDELRIMPPPDDETLDELQATID